MPITEHESNSQTCTLTTEHVLNSTTPETTDGVFTLVLDVSQLVNGETLVVKVKEKARSGDTQRLLHAFSIVGAQSEPLWMVTFGPVLHGWDVTITQTGGTGRAIPWSLRKIV